MTNQRDSFIFYRSFYESSKKLPKEDKAEIFDAICSYALDGELVDLSIIPEAIFTVIKPNLDANRKRWENGCKEKKKTNVDDDENKQTGSKSEANRKQTGSKSEANKDKDVNKDPNLELEFESFWKSYNPIHTGKGNKEKSKDLFLKALKKDSIESINKGLAAYMQHCHSKNSYTKSVEVWLKNEGWKDEYNGITSNQSNTNQNLCDIINKMIGYTLLTKIILSTSNKAVLHFKTESDYNSLLNSEKELREKVKEEIAASLGTNGFEFKF